MLSKDFTVANIKSAIKRNRTNELARIRNKNVRTELKTRVKNAVSAAAENSDAAEDTLKQAIRKLDIAASKGIIHKNQAANRKSRLMKRIARPAS